MITAHQEEIKSKILQLLIEGDRVLLQGSAGVGKTWLVNDIINNLPAGKVVCSAPTNKAVRVLMEKVTSPRAEFSTTHSALKLKRKVNNRSGKISFKPEFSAFDPPLKGTKYLIIDETSMISTELLKYIEEFSTEYKVKILFIGDYKQLPPVGEEASPIFEAGYPTVELTEIIRQGANNPIISLSRSVDEGIASKSDSYRQVNDNDVEGYVFSQDSNRIVETLARANGTDEIKYLAWTNKEVDSVNKLVREKIYGTPAKIEKGETLVFNAPYSDKFFTNEEIVVKELETATITVKHNFKAKQMFGATQSNEMTLKVYVINPGCVHINKAWPAGVIVVHEDSDKDYKMIIDDYVAQCKNRTMFWRDYYQFMEQFGDMKYNHALTVHKSQGSTFQKTIVNVRNISMNPKRKEKDKMLYTAITRTANLLILYNA